jgi:hypothetical protein
MPQGHERVNGTVGGISYLLVPSIFWAFSLGRDWYPSVGALFLQFTDREKTCYRASLEILRAKTLGTYGHALNLRSQAQLCGRFKICSTTCVKVCASFFPTRFPSGGKKIQARIRIATGGLQPSSPSDFAGKNRTSAFRGSSQNASIIET